MTLKEFKITPVSKPRMTRSDKWKQRKCVTNYWDYKEELIKLAKEKDYKIGFTIEGLIFVLPMAKSWSKKKKAEYVGQPHQQKPDLDNLVKGYKDALLKEDSVVWRYKDISKVWGYEGSIVVGNPLEITLRLDDLIEVSPRH